MRLAAFLVLALLLARPVHAEVFKDLDAAVALTDQTMKLVAKGDLKAGFGLIKPFTVVPDAEVDAMLGKAEGMQPMLVGRFGQSLGYELVRREAASPSLVRVVYLQKFELHAMVWRFTLYHGADGWTINTFAFKDDIADAFEH